MIKTLTQITIENDDLFHQAVNELGKDIIREIIKERSTYVPDTRITENYVISTKKIEFKGSLTFYTSVKSVQQEVSFEEQILYGRKFRTAKNAAVANRIFTEYLKKMGC